MKKEWSIWTDFACSVAFPRNFECICNRIGGRAFGIGSHISKGICFLAWNVFFVKKSESLVNYEQHSNKIQWRTIKAKISDSNSRTTEPIYILFLRASNCQLINYFASQQTQQNENQPFGDMWYWYAMTQIWRHFRCFYYFGNLICSDWYEINTPTFASCEKYKQLENSVSFLKGRLNATPSAS